MRTAIVLLTGVFCLAACSGGSRSSSATTTTANSHPVGSLGSTLVIPGVTGAAAVTLLDMIDPIADATGRKAQPGTRYVAVRLRFVSRATGVYREDPYAGLAVVGNDGNGYPARPGQAAGCSDFNRGNIDLQPDQQVTGCVEVQLPEHVKVVQIQLVSDLGLGNTVATWNLPHGS